MGRVTSTVDRIVVGLDGTPDDRPLVRWCSEFAAGVGAEVVAAHFIPKTTAWIVAGVQVDSAKYAEELREHLQRDVLVPLSDRGLLLHLYVQIGDPANGLAALANRCGAGLIVIGQRAHNAAHDVIFGRTAHRLARVTDVPVVSVPRRAPALHAVR